jgi:hypothetical protein
MPFFGRLKPGCRGLSPATDGFEFTAFKTTADNPSAGVHRAHGMLRSTPPVEMAEKGEHATTTARTVVFRY